MPFADTCDTGTGRPAIIGRGRLPRLDIFAQWLRPKFLRHSDGQRGRYLGAGDDTNILLTFAEGQHQPRQIRSLTEGIPAQPRNSSPPVSSH